MSDMAHDELLIIDAAVEVAVFSKTHEWPAEGSPDFFKFAQLLDDLATKINRRYPEFNRNVLAARGANKGKEEKFEDQGEPGPGVP